MDRGKSSLEKDIILMLNDIKYFRELNNSDIFEYTVGDGKINPLVIDYDIQHKLLKRMNDNGIIKIIEEKQELSPVLSWVDEPLADQFRHTVYVLDTSNTTFTKNTQLAKKKTHTMGISFEDINNALCMSIDDKGFHKIRGLNVGSEPYRILRALFFQPPKLQLSKYDIFPNGTAERRNLSQIISKAKLKFLVDYGFIKVDKGNIRYINNVVSISERELKKFLSKINEKYRKNFTLYL